MNDGSQLKAAITTTVNCTFPAVLRTRSWDAYEQLHSYASYEQWYNAELLMHFRRELHGSQFDDQWVCVRGEAPIETKNQRADWAFLKWEPSYAAGRCFARKDVFAAGETKVIGLAAAGSGANEERQKIARLAEQLGHDSLSQCLCFAYFVLPCWNRRPQNLDDSVRKSLEDYLFPGVAEQFQVEANAQHLQIITGSFGTEKASQESGANDPRFALLQMVLCRTPEGQWEAVEPPVQHRLSSYLAAIEARTPAPAC